MTTFHFEVKGVSMPEGGRECGFFVVFQENVGLRAQVVEE